MCLIFVKFWIGNFAGMVAISISSVLFSWLFYDNLNVESFYHPFKIMLVVLNLQTETFPLKDRADQFHSRLPWNQSTYIGYVDEMSFSIFTTQAYFLVDGVVMLLFISICLCYQSFYKMLKNSIRMRNQFDGNRFDHKFLCDLIRFHISVKK